MVCCCISIDFACHSVSANEVSIFGRWASSMFLIGRRYFNLYIKYIEVWKTFLSSLSRDIRFEIGLISHNWEKTRKVEPTCMMMWEKEETKSSVV